MFAFLGIALLWVEAWVLLMKSPLAVSHIEVTNLQVWGHKYWMGMSRIWEEKVTNMGVTNLQGKGAGFCCSVRVLWRRLRWVFDGGWLGFCG